TYDAKVIGNAADSERLPRLDITVYAAEETSLLGTPVKIFDVSGHTIGHIAFYLPDEKALFSADSLMAMGCGRLFEGTPEMMLASLSQLSALPDDITVYSGHEYTSHNAKFAATIEPGNTDLQDRLQRISNLRATDTPTVPSSLADEKATNPFLRCHLDSVKSGVGLPGADDVAVFAEVRNRRNNF
ncbi:MAG: hydroxyacylglutathione hydrolase, partial [Pseudoruegeria sp.]